MLEVWLWKVSSPGAAGVPQLPSSTRIMRMARAVLARGLAHGLNPGCGARQSSGGCWSQHPLEPRQLKGAVGSLGSDYRLLPVNYRSSPSLLCKVCYICPVAVGHVKIFAVSLKLGRLVPAAGMFPILPFPRRLDDRKPALLP